MSKKLELRSWPDQELSYDDAEIMLKKYNFYSKSKNPLAKGIRHQYEQIEYGDEGLIVDHATGLTWQQSGASDRRGYLFLEL